MYKLSTIPWVKIRWEVRENSVSFLPEVPRAKFYSTSTLPLKLDSYIQGIRVKSEKQQWELKKTAMGSETKNKNKKQNVGVGLIFMLRKQHLSIIYIV